MTGQAILYVIALNGPTDLRHTHLTRAIGTGATETGADETSPDLPPLADWIGAEALDTDRIDLFPVKDLGAMTLSSYINDAFAPQDAIPDADRRRLDALDGTVLLVPGDAVTGSVKPGQAGTLIATIPLARPDMSMQMAPTDSARPSPTKAPAPPAEDPRDRLARRGTAIWLLLAVLAVAAVLWMTR